MANFVVLRNTRIFKFYKDCGFTSACPNNIFKKNYSITSVSKKKNPSAAKNVSAIFSAQYQELHSPPGVITASVKHVSVPKENLVEFIFKGYEEHADVTALTCAVGDRHYDYGMLRMLVNRCAQAMLGHCGMQPKEVIGLLLPNIPEYVITCYGALEAGLVVTFVNPLYTPLELKRQFENAGVKMIVTIPLLMQVVDILAPQLQGYKGTICVGGEDDVAKKVYGLESLLTAGHEADLPKVEPNEIAILPYSSGTTGLPKGVMLSHHNLVANLVQGDNPMFFQATNQMVAKDGGQHRCLTVLPLFHIYGFNAIMNIVMKHRCHFITIPRFTADDYIKALVQYKPTCIFAVPSLLLFLATYPAVTKEHLASIEFVMSGAASLTESLVNKLMMKVDRDDILIRQGYGMTETSPVTFLMPKEIPQSKIGTIGVLYPGTEARVIDLKTGENLSSFHPGELLVRGPQVMVGYLNNEEATAEMIDKDGWLHTGDVAYYDQDYYFYIVDRTKELIKVKGNQVSPTELENLLLELEGVADVAIVGVPDALAGEVPRAYIVRKPGSNITEEDVTAFINPKVTHYKKLVGGVRFIKEIPRNPSGKILRSDLAANY